MLYVTSFLLRIPLMLHIMVWVNIVVVEVGLIIGAYLMVEKAKSERDSDDPSAMSDEQIAMLRGLGGILAIMAVLWICVICFLRERYDWVCSLSWRLVSCDVSRVLCGRIGVAVDLVEEAAECVTSLGSLPLFCLLLVVVFVAFSALWLLYTTYLVSSADVSQ
jgi:hypothetical protein